MNKQRRLLIFGIVIVVVIAAISIGIIWMVGMNGSKPSNQQAKKPVPQYENTQSLVDEVNKKAGTQDYAGAIELIEKQKTIDDPKTQNLLAGAYANSGDTKKALEIFKALDAAGKLPKTDFANVAETAEQAKEYRTAIDFYKKAKEYAKTSNTETIDQLAVYDYKIAELEKKV